MLQEVIKLSIDEKRWSSGSVRVMDLLWICYGFGHILSAIFMIFSENQVGWVCNGSAHLMCNRWHGRWGWVRRSAPAHWALREVRVVASCGAPREGAHTLGTVFAQGVVRSWSSIGITL